MGSPPPAPRGPQSARPHAVRSVLPKKTPPLANPRDNTDQPDAPKRSSSPGRWI